MFNTIKQEATIAKLKSDIWAKDTAESLRLYSEIRREEKSERRERKQAKIDRANLKRQKRIDVLKGMLLQYDIEALSTKE